jgi:imidazoleglycerol-phosphate dehydratase
MERSVTLDRKTAETEIQVQLGLDGTGVHDIITGIPFFDHMLTLFSVHGFFDLKVRAAGDIDVDFHHTVEDVGILLGDALNQALGERRGIKRYGYAVTPMDEALSAVAIDLSKRPFLVLNIPPISNQHAGFDIYLAKEFFRAFANHCGLNLHINVFYGENLHHIIESIFKGLGRALDQAVAIDTRIKQVRSSKGML